MKGSCKAGTEHMAGEQVADGLELVEEPGGTLGEEEEEVQAIEVKGEEGMIVVNYEDFGQEMLEQPDGQEYFNQAMSDQEYFDDQDVLGHMRLGMDEGEEASREQLSTSGAAAPLASASAARDPMTSSTAAGPSAGATLWKGVREAPIGRLPGNVCRDCGKMLPRSMSEKPKRTERLGLPSIWTSTHPIQCTTSGALYGVGDLGPTVQSSHATWQTPV